MRDDKKPHLLIDIRPAVEIAICRLKDCLCEFISLQPLTIDDEKMGALLKSSALGVAHLSGLSGLYVELACSMVILAPGTVCGLHL